MIKRLLSPRDFGQTIEPPMSKDRVLRLLRQDRVVGAHKPEGSRGWLIPEGAKIKGAGKRLPSASKGISPAEFARKYGRSQRRAYELLYARRVKGASKGQYGWEIPPDAPWPADDGFG